MFRRYFFPVLAGLAFVISSSLPASAQVGQLRGKVMLKQADGTKIPASDAAIDVFEPTYLENTLQRRTKKANSYLLVYLS